MAETPAKVVFIAPAALTQDDLALAALYSREYPSGPLLLNPPGDLDPRVKAEITRALGAPKTVSTDAGKPLILQSITILGDTDAISADAESQLQAMGYNVARDDSADIVADSLDLAARSVSPAGNMQISVPLYLVASDDPASISVASAASRRDLGRIVYTDGSTLRSDARAFLDAIEPDVAHDTAQVYAIGQEAVAAVGSWTPGPSKTLTNFVGATPGATAASAFKALIVTPIQVTVVNPGSFVDTALALFDGGVPLAIDPTAGLDSDVAAWLNANSTTIGTVWLDGDTDTMPDSTGSAVTDALAPASLKSVDNPLAAQVLLAPNPRKTPAKTPATRAGPP